MVLLAAEQQLTVPAIAQIVRADPETVGTWLKRYQAEGVNGLADKPRVGSPGKVTAAYREQLLQAVVRQRPRSLKQPYSIWTLQQRLAEQPGIRVEAETMRIYLKAADIVLTRPQHKVSSPAPEYQVKKRRLKTFATT